MNLYLCSNNLGNYYILSTDPTSAKIYIEKLLNESEYGFLKDREITSIELIAKQITFLGEKPIFSSKSLFFIDENTLCITKK